MTQAESTQRHGALTGPEYSRVAGHFTAGIFVVGAKAEHGSVSTLGSAIASVSVEPPMLMVCLDRDSATGKAVEKSGHFTVDVLAEHQRDLATRVRGKDVRVNGDGASPDSQPLVEASLAHLECSLTERVTSATHSILIGVVQRGSATDEMPLVQYRGEYGGFAPAD
jgi:4-nitrophenol 2-monooxygenase / 4-nitrocatechol 4-monooxygenase, reductase component